METLASILEPQIPYFEQREPYKFNFPLLILVAIENWQFLLIIKNWYKQMENIILYYFAWKEKLMVHKYLPYWDRGNFLFAIRQLEAIIDAFNLNNCSCRGRQIKICFYSPCISHSLLEFTWSNCGYFHPTNKQVDVFYLLPVRKFHGSYPSENMSFTSLIYKI